MKPRLWIGVLLTVWMLAFCQRASASDNNTPTPAFIWNGARVLINSDGNFMTIVPSSRALHPGKIPDKTLEPVALSTTRYSWADVRDAPLKKLPRLTVDYFSAQLGQPGCTLEQNATCVLLKITNPSRILSPVRTELSIEDVTLDNQLNTTRESAAHIRYRPRWWYDSRPHDLVLVRYDLAEFYAALLVDSPSGYAENIVGYLTTQAGILIVFDTRLTGNPKTELELVGGGLDNSLLPNLLRIQVDKPATSEDVKVVVQPSDWSGFKDPHVFDDILDEIDKIPKDMEEQSPFLSLSKTDVRKDLKTGNLFAGRLKPGAVHFELRDAKGSVVAKAEAGSDAIGTLVVPKQFLAQPGVQIFTLIVHHPWGRDIVRPIAIRRNH